MVADGDSGKGALQHACVGNGGNGDANDHQADDHVEHGAPNLQTLGSFFFFGDGPPLGRGGGSRLLLAALFLA